MIPPIAGPTTAAEPIATPVNAIDLPMACRLEISCTKLNAAGVNVPLVNPCNARITINTGIDGVDTYTLMIMTCNSMPISSVFLRPTLSEKYPPIILPSKFVTEYVATTMLAVNSSAPKDIANGVTTGSWTNKSKKQMTIIK